MICLKTSKVLMQSMHVCECVITTAYANYTRTCVQSTMTARLTVTKKRRLPAEWLLAASWAIAPTVSTHIKLLVVLCVQIDVCSLMVAADWYALSTDAHILAIITAWCSIEHSITKCWYSVAISTNTSQNAALVVCIIRQDSRNRKWLIFMEAMQSNLFLASFA